MLQISERNYRDFFYAHFKNALATYTSTMNSLLGDELMAREITTEPLRILYVEDSDYLRELTTDLLAGDDREIVALSSAEEALLEFERNPYDLLITDISLPVMSGMDLVKSVLKKVPQAWIVIVSGYRLPIELSELGPNIRALPKPFEAGQINALLSEIRPC